MESSAPGTDTAWPHAATLVLAAETPRQRRWAVNTAIEIVRKLAAQRPKVVLTDLQMRSPSALAAALGVEDGPGIADVLLRDAAFSAVAKRPDGESFFFLAVGSSPPPIEILYRHPRWKKIAARLGDTDAHLLPCVAASDWLEAGPIPGFEACIVLNAAGLEIELPDEARRLAEFLAPPEVREERGGPVELPPYAAAEPDTQPIPGIARPVGERVEAPTPEPSPPPAPVEASPAAAWRAASEPPSGARLSFFRRQKPSRLAPMAITAAAAILVLFLWRTSGSRQAPESPTGLEAAADPQAVETTDAPPVEPVVERGPRLQEVSLPYSVAIASFSSMDDAIARQREWTRADLPFYVAPTVVRGVVYYRVFAGMMPEREAAEALMAQLVREGIKDTTRSWDVRPARLAFNFGTFATPQEARSVLETLFGRGVPAYMVPAAAEAGSDSIAYRVYAGGYEQAEDARPLREHIEQAGIQVELVERVGLLLK